MDSYIDQLSIPVVAAPMFLISNPAMVLACAESGIVGSFPALNQRTTEGFEEWLVEIESGIKRIAESTSFVPPFAVNLIVHHTNPRLEADLEICIKHQVPIIITSLGAVARLVDQVHEYGGLVYHDVTNKKHALKAVEAGVDGLILVCGGAGGHAGTAHPFALIEEIRSFFAGTILLSGCISTGRDIAAALQAGADLAYMGTRFINTTESVASYEYKKMIIDSEIQDVVYTAAVSGVPANFLAQSLLSVGIGPEQWSKAAPIDFGKELDAAKAWKTIWSAGQGVTSIDDNLPIEILVQRLKKEMVLAIETQSKLLQKYSDPS